MKNDSPEQLRSFFLRVLTTRTVLRLSSADAPIHVGEVMSWGIPWSIQFNWLRAENIIARWANGVSERRGGLLGPRNIVVCADRHLLASLDDLLSPARVLWRAVPRLEAGSDALQACLDALNGAGARRELSLQVPYQYAFLVRLVARNRGTSLESIIREALWLWNHET